MALAAWTTVRKWFNDNADSYVLASLDEGEPLKPYQSYLRVWLAQMFLVRRVSWLRTHFPAVHAEVKLPFGTEPATSFARVVRPADDKLGEGVLINYPLTELLPYNGGVVEIDAALFGLEGEDPLKAGVSLLEQFSGLIAPPLGQVLTIAEKIAVGARDFLDRAAGGVHLVLHQALTSEGGGGANVMRSGYLAVVLATAGQVPAGELRVQGDQLYRGAAPFTTHDFILLRIEARGQRDNWRSPGVEEARGKAVDALLNGDKEAAQRYRGAALASVLRSHDFTEADKRRIAVAINREWDELAGYGLGFSRDILPADLLALVDRYPMSQTAAAALGPVTMEEAMAGT
ncbi:MAG TPA: hypothetical protein VE664_06630 [Actinomycetes bacterium]|nr:hypothetical protein [Actinomycetes bacterium]